MTRRVLRLELLLNIYRVGCDLYFFKFFLYFHNVDFSSPEKLLSSFPTLKLRSLTQKISNPRWVVPVLPEQELEALLNVAIALTIAGKLK